MSGIVKTVLLQEYVTLSQWDIRVTRGGKKYLRGNVYSSSYGGDVEVNISIAGRPCVNRYGSTLVFVIEADEPEGVCLASSHYGKTGNLFYLALGRPSDRYREFVNAQSVDLSPLGEDRHRLVKTFFDPKGPYVTDVLGKLGGADGLVELLNFGLTENGELK